ncbi:hypothetical protein SAMN05216275_10846 [Streptosporangium canum]|uniref:Transglycosylase SLT domain-containing protein n=1 Tax=Streptosporangium canum TaxID=324952 RepID=A0A1I3QID1_9ACTN|nr:hypothetical protein [Streptosporangium canum]SFJ33798.1 hypothetical protein SAMN05216275_10846 [Streptosporangium canum]
MLKRTAGTMAALITAVVVATSAGAGAAFADGASFSRELTTVAQAAGVSEERVYSMAVSLMNGDPEDDYRFPDEVFAEAPRSWGAVVAFVKRFWRQIVDAAKAAGEWAWWKAGQCATGAVSEISDKFHGDLSDPETVVAVGVYGCLKRLRG